MPQLPHSVVPNRLAQLAGILKRQAELTHRIATEERYFSEYFRVGFYGKSFPPHLRNKQFIYRGTELERISAFVERLQDKYPLATVLPSNAPPGPEIVHGTKMWLQVVKVRTKSLHGSKRTFN